MEDIPMASAALPSKPPCKYGEKCYRTSEQHKTEFSHPLDNPPLCTSAPVNEVGPPAKRSKILATSTSRKQQNSTPCAGQGVLSAEAQCALAALCSKYLYYMSRTFGIDDCWNDGSSLSLRNILMGTKAELIETCLFSYEFDLEWIMGLFEPGDRGKPVLLVHSLRDGSKMELLQQREKFDNVKLVQARLEIAYGTHHTKMLLLHYRTGLRVVITTANLVPGDWLQKSQAVWSSPLFPAGSGDSTTCFKRDLLEYMQSYGANQLSNWIDVINHHDMSACKVFLIGSVPGRHTGSKMDAFGHLKLRKILQQHGPSHDTCIWPVICQFSSIGSLGSQPGAWLEGEFLNSLCSARGTSKLSAKPPLQLIFPSVENVRQSLQGYAAGGSLPYSQSVATKQPYLKNYLHQWRSDCRGRTSAAPHIKSYTRVSPDGKRLAWFLMTSSNLSKAAWGAYEKNQSQLMIRSYELGVLFLPQMYDLDTFINDPTFMDGKAFPLPFDIPLTPFCDADEPWMWDVPHLHQPDSLGELWKP